MVTLTLELPEVLAEKLAQVAADEGRSPESVITRLVEALEVSSKPKTNWALAMAQAAQESGIAWKDIPDLSERGSDIYAEGLYNDWLTRTQADDTDNHD